MTERIERLERIRKKCKNILPVIIVFLILIILVIDVKILIFMGLDLSNLKSFLGFLVIVGIFFLGSKCLKKVYVKLIDRIIDICVYFERQNWDVIKEFKLEKGKSVEIWFKDADLRKICERHKFRIYATMISDKKIKIIVKDAKGQSFKKYKIRFFTSLSEAYQAQP